MPLRVAYTQMMTWEDVAAVEAKERWRIAAWRERFVAAGIAGAEDVRCLALIAWGLGTAEIQAPPAQSVFGHPHVADKVAGQRKP